MKQARSQTAELVAAVRAGHTRHDGGLIFSDPIAESLLGFPWTTVVRHRWLYRWVSRVLLGKVRASHWQILWRARRAEEQIERAWRSGVRQYLVLGAGLDSFAWRQAQTLPGLRVFEVDHPLTQAFKRDRILAAGLSMPEALRLVPLDLEHDPLHRLAERCDWHPRQRGIVAWMGTTYYLQPDTIARTLSDLRDVMAPGSQLLLDHGLDDASIDAPTQVVYARLRDFVAQRGEPMMSRFSDADMTAMAEQAGWQVAQRWSMRDEPPGIWPEEALPLRDYSRLVLLTLPD
ncbi:MAG: hypothetical protein RIQ97_2370 [Pseudomonadota bacterium]|jgi:methyltransferase (TIGR00027 family)